MHQPGNQNRSSAAEWSEVEHRCDRLLRHRRLGADRQPEPTDRRQMRPRAGPGNHHGDQHDVRKPDKETIRALNSFWPRPLLKPPQAPAPPRRTRESLPGAKLSRTRKESRKKPAPRSDPADKDPDTAPPATARRHRKAIRRSPAARPRSFLPSRSPDKSAPREAGAREPRRCFRSKRKAPSTEARSRRPSPESGAPSAP